MAFRVGDKVMYVNNNAYDENERLLKRPIGTIQRLAYGIYAVCNWDYKNDNFCLSVPITYIKLYKENK